MQTVTQPDVPDETNWIVHNYSAPGVYRISVSKEIEAIRFDNDAMGDKGKVVSGVMNWGAAQWISLTRSFRGCSNFNPIFYDAPDLSTATSMELTFGLASSFNQDVGAWDVSNVTDMVSTFNGANSFNQDIGAWDIGKVTDMTTMLRNTGFSQDNFEKTIIGWANRAETDGVQTGVPLGIVNQTYSNKVHNDAYGVATGGINDAVTAIATLTGAPYNWTITGGTQV